MSRKPKIFIHPIFFVPWTRPWFRSGQQKAMWTLTAIWRWQCPQIRILCFLYSGDVHLKLFLKFSIVKGVVTDHRSHFRNEIESDFHKVAWLESQNARGPSTKRNFLSFKPGVLLRWLNDVKCFTTLIALQISTIVNNLVYYRVMLYDRGHTPNMICLYIDNDIWCIICRIWVEYFSAELSTTQCWWVLHATPRWRPEPSRLEPLSWSPTSRCRFFSLRFFQAGVVLE